MAEEGITYLFNDIMNLFRVENATFNLTWLARSNSLVDKRCVAFHGKFQVADMPSLLQNIFKLIPLFELLLWIRQMKESDAHAVKLRW